MLSTPQHEGLQGSQDEPRKVQIKNTFLHFAQDGDGGVDLDDIAVATEWRRQTTEPAASTRWDLSPMTGFLPPPGLEPAVIPTLLEDGREDVVRTGDAHSQVGSSGAASSSGPAPSGLARQVSSKSSQGSRESASARETFHRQLSADADPSGFARQITNLSLASINSKNSGFCRQETELPWPTWEPSCASSPSGSFGHRQNETYDGAFRGMPPPPRSWTDEPARMVIDSIPASSSGKFAEPAQPAVSAATEADSKGTKRHVNRRKAKSLITLAQKAQQREQAQVQQAAHPASAPSMKLGDFNESASRQPRPRFCPQCGGALRMHFQFCQFCGAQVPGTGGPVKK